MNNMSLHFHDYEEKYEKNAFFGLKYKYCYAITQTEHYDFLRLWFALSHAGRGWVEVSWEKKNPSRFVLLSSIYR